MSSDTRREPCTTMHRPPRRDESKTGLGLSWVPREGVQADVHLLRSLESYETDTSAPRTLFLSPMQASQARARRLILGLDPFSDSFGDHAVTNTYGSAWVVRVQQKTRRGEPKRYARTNSEYRGVRFDGARRRRRRRLMSVDSTKKATDASARLATRATTTSPPRTSTRTHSRTRV